MSSRRSSRLHNQPGQKPSDDAQDVSVGSEKFTRRKKATALKVAKNTEVSNGKKNCTTKVVAWAAAGRDEARAMQGLDKLSYLSPEIFGMIADNVTDQRTISALSRTSQKLYALMTPRLYGRVAVAAMFHAHIAKLIRTLEPHLSIKQKKQLKKEGKYKGQQEKYRTGLDEEKIPVCAGYVRQLIIGASDPGKKHKYIVDRYYEEALKNMKNLDIVETSVVNEFICEGIATLASLKALSVYAYEAKPNDVVPLARVKSLKHLHLQIGYEILATGQSILRNSMSTLQSLDIITNSWCRQFLHSWSKNLKSSGHDTISRLDKRPDFPALRSLHVEGMMIDEEFIKEFPRAIDLSKLRELTLVRLKDPQTLLWPFLASLITSFRRSNTPLNLRTLFVDMHDPHLQYDTEQQKALFIAKCSFIASFDTLTTLNVRGYGQYTRNEASTNPGLSDTLLQGILKHKNLRVLRISYVGKISGLEIPYLGAEPIGDIIDGLPLLREFEFAPDESRMDKISQALCRSKTLEDVTCFPHESWHAFPRPDPLGMNILSSILSTFMSNAKVDAGSKNFVWEEHHKLKHLDLSHTKWEIASRFGKAKKGHKKPEKFQMDVQDGTREVWHQVVPRTQYIHIGYDPLFEWVTKVEKEIE